MGMTLNERRTAASMNMPTADLRQARSESWRSTARVVGEPRATKSPARPDGAETRFAADAFRLANRELQRWEQMFDNCREGDPNSYIAEIQAAERQVETARLNLSKLERR